MKENIHPAYGECTVRCACGETFTTGSTKKRCGWKSAPSATLSIPANRSWLTPADGLTGLRNVTGCKPPERRNRPMYFGLFFSFMR